MSEDNLYVKADLLDYADTSNVSGADGKWGSKKRLEALKEGLNLGDDEIESFRSGGYQGEMLFVFEKGGYCWLLKDSYGSCSGCDAWVGARDREAAVKHFEITCRNAYAFDNWDDAAAFLESKSDEGEEYMTFGYGWLPVVDAGLEAIEKLQ